MRKNFLIRYVKKLSKKYQDNFSLSLLFLVYSSSYCSAGVGEKGGNDVDRDSGHGGSPTREPQGQDADDECSYTYNDGGHPGGTPGSKKSGNFWRRFTMKNRNKR